MKQILVVDDNKDILDLIEKSLVSHGYVVTTVNSGKKAVDILNKGKFDMVITDVVMPDIDGISLTLQIEKSKKGIPIIVMSGGGNVTHSKTALGYAENFPSVYRTFRKPFCTFQLCEVVDSVLRPSLDGL